MKSQFVPNTERERDREREERIRANTKALFIDSIS
jgi:hypothetical protein